MVKLEYSGYVMIFLCEFTPVICSKYLSKEQVTRKINTLMTYYSLILENWKGGRLGKITAKDNATGK